MNHSISPQQKKVRTRFVLVMIVCTCVVWYLLIGRSFFTFSQEEEAVQPQTVELVGKTLSVFDTKYQFVIVPDRVEIRPPYVLVVQPYQNMSVVYDLENKNIIRRIEGIILDYRAGNVVTSVKNSSFYNGRSLGVLCQQALILENDRVLCTAQNTDMPLAGMRLLTLDGMTGRIEEKEETERIIVSLARINGAIYRGEFDVETEESYLVWEENEVKLPDYANIIYPMGERVMIGSLAGKHNERTLSYYQLETDGTVTLMERGKIVLYDGKRSVTRSKKLPSVVAEMNGLSLQNRSFCCRMESLSQFTNSMFIFLDESGQFKKSDHEKYFIIGSFTVGDYRRTEKQFRAFQRKKYPRGLRYQSEIKFSSVRIDKNLRIKTLQFISGLDVRIRYSYMRAENIPLDFRNKNRINTGLLYTHIVGETLQMYLPTADKEFRVFCDQRDLAGFTVQDFQKTLVSQVLPLLPQKTIVQVQMVDSTANTNIQIADWIVGALAKYHNGSPEGEEYYEILKDVIVFEGKELFKDNWS